MFGKGCEKNDIMHRCHKREWPESVQWKVVKKVGSGGFGQSQTDAQPDEKRSGYALDPDGEPAASLEQASGAGSKPCPPEIDHGAIDGEQHAEQQKSQRFGR